MIVDVNVLVSSINEDDPAQPRVADWLHAALTGPSRVGLPIPVLAGFVRVVTMARVFPDPLSAQEAHDVVAEWLDLPAVWVPPVGERTWAAYLALTAGDPVTGNLVPDALLAAIALEHGVPIASRDAVFARWSQVRWINPAAAHR